MRETAIARELREAEERKAQKIKDEFHRRRQQEIKDGKRTTGATANRKRRKHGRSR